MTTYATKTLAAASIALPALLVAAIRAYDKAMR